MAKKSLTDRIAELKERQKRTNADLQKLELQQLEEDNKALETKFKNFANALRAYSKESSARTTKTALIINSQQATHSVVPVDMINPSLDSIIEQYAGKEGDK